MRFYYTTSKEGGADPQNKPSLSLGGYISAIPVPKKVFDSFFGDISELTKSTNPEQYLCVFLKNEIGVDVTNIRIWFDYPENCYSSIKVAASDLNNGKSERVENMNTAPFYIDDFHDAKDEANAYNAGDLVTDEVIAVWFERTLLQDVIEKQKLYKEIDEYDVEEIVPETEDNITLNLAWD